MSRELLALRCMVRAQDHLLVVGRLDSFERVAAFLMDMADRQEELDQIELPMSRQDIGDYLGLTIETVSRVLSRLRDKGSSSFTAFACSKSGKPEAIRLMCE